MNTYDYSGHFALIEAIHNNNYDFVLKASSDSNFTQKNPFHWTPLHYSVAFDNLEITTKILNIRDDYLNVQDKYQRTPTSLAARRGNPEILKVLLDKRADLSIGLPLCYAATKGNVDCVSSLIHYGCNVNENDTVHPDLKYGLRYTPLIIAIKEYHPKVVKLLVDHGADVNFGAGRVLTPLHWACQDGTLEMVKALVEKGAELNHRCQHDNTPIDYAILYQEFDIIKYLLEQSCSLNQVGKKIGETPLHTAASMIDNIDIIKEMMKYSPNLDIQNIDGATPLYLCSCVNKMNEEIFEALVEGGADVTISASNSWTPLHLCCANGNLKCVKLILEKSKDAVNAVTMDNVTPLYVAASRGHEKICKELLENGAYLNIRINKFIDLCDCNPFVIDDNEIKVGYIAETIALEKENHNVVELINHYKEHYFDMNMEIIRIIDHVRNNILDEKNINEFENIDESDLLGWTCLHHAAESNNLNLMRLCIDRVKNVDVSDKYGRTPFTIAAANGNLEIMKLLQEHSADMNLGGALFHAIENKQLDSVKFIVEADGNVNIQDRKKRTPIMYAAIKKDLACLESLLQKSFDITLRDEDEETVLHHARNCSGDIFKLLVEKGADVNAQNSRQETPLALAIVADDNLEAVKVLLENGADTNISNHFQETPLHYVAEHGKLEIVKEILKYSPDINAKDDSSCTPFMRSLDNIDVRILEILFEHGADFNINMKGGWTPLHVCAYYGEVEYARFLFKLNIDVNALSQESISPIYTASSQGRVGFVKELLREKSFIDVRTTNLNDWSDSPHFVLSLPKLPGSSPLTAAVCGGHLDVVKLLHENGTTLETLTEELMDLLKLAIENSHSSVFEYLMQHELNLNTQEKGELYELAKENPAFQETIRKLFFA